MMETNKEKHFYFSMWKRGNTGQFWKGTREQGPPWDKLIIIIYTVQ